LTAIQKSVAINLCTENDWSGLVTDVMAKAKTKKDVSVIISVFPENVSPRPSIFWSAMFLPHN
jgi:hypothetical protein